MDLGKGQLGIQLGALCPSPAHPTLVWAGRDLGDQQWAGKPSMGSADGGAVSHGSCLLVGFGSCLISCSGGRFPSVSTANLSS